MREIPARLWALGVLSGALQILPFPIAGPAPVWRTEFCWVALVPLLLALTGTSRHGQQLSVRQGALLGYLCGFVWYLGNCYWVYQTMYLYGGLIKPVAAVILVLFCLYLGLYHALFGALMVGLRNSRISIRGVLILSPFAWVAVELARSRITGLPWDLLGNAQVDNPLLTRLAPVCGVYGLSFVIAAINALWLVRVQVPERRYTRAILTLAGVVIVVGYVSAFRLLIPPRKEDAPAIATLVQENLEVGAQSVGPQPSMEQLVRSFAYLSLHPEAKYYAGVPELSTTPYYDRTRPAESIAPDLIVWPESPAPFEENNEGFRVAMAELARKAAAPIIVGNTTVERDDRVARGYDLFNSASFVAPDGTFAGRYDKIHLVPFGEYTPFHRVFFFAKNLLNEVGTFDSGSERRLFAINGHRYGTFICYESIFGDEVRQFTAAGADVLVNISNDGWYGDTSAPWQHLDMVRMRAIENHRWILRATNTGVTAAIDPYGRIRAAAPRHIRTSLAVRFNYEHGLTFYVRHGDIFAYLCATLTMLALTYSLWARCTRLKA